MNDYGLKAFQEAAEMELNDSITEVGIMRLERNYVPAMSRLAFQLAETISSNNTRNITDAFESCINKAEIISRAISEIVDESEFSRASQLIFLKLGVGVGIASTLKKFGCNVCEVSSQLSTQTETLKQSIDKLMVSIDGVRYLYNGTEEQLETDLTIRQSVTEFLNAYLVALRSGLSLWKARAELPTTVGPEAAEVLESVMMEVFHEQVDEVFTEKANIDGDMKPIIKALNAKGYKTKYSSSGHPGIMSKHDRDNDKVREGNLYIDARIMFDGDYKFPSAPKWWVWRTVDGNDYLDVKEIYLKDGETASKAKYEWKAKYMATLKTWVDDLPPAKVEKVVSDSDK